MRKTQIVLLTLSFVAASQCSVDKAPPSELEAALSRRLDAEKVRVTQEKVTTTTNGETNYENYLLVKIYNSKKLEEMEANKRMFSDKCEQIVKYLTDSVQFEPRLDVNEIRLQNITTVGFAIFKNEQTTTVTYKLR